MSEGEREYFRTYNREWREANPDKLRTWHEANRDKVRRHSAKSKLKHRYEGRYEEAIAATEEKLALLKEIRDEASIVPYVGKD